MPNDILINLCIVRGHFLYAFLIEISIYNHFLVFAHFWINKAIMLGHGAYKPFETMIRWNEKEEKNKKKTQKLSSFSEYFFPGPSSLIRHKKRLKLQRTQKKWSLGVKQQKQNEQKRDKLTLYVYDMKSISCSSFVWFITLLHEFIIQYATDFFNASSFSLRHRRCRKYFILFALKIGQLGSRIRVCVIGSIKNNFCERFWWS